MGLYRQFPAASDRMGILWTVLPIRDCVVVEYGPAGTTHYGAEIIGDLGIDICQNLFSTHVDENDIIMGDTTRLEKAVKEVDKRYHPRCIFVLGSSLTSVIAADIKGICRMLENEVRAKLIPFEHGGFRGDYSLGIRDALSTMAKEIVEKSTETRIGTYNIVGACHDIYRIGSDVNEIRQIMKECFHMEAACVFPYDTCYDKLKTCAQSELTLVLRSESRPAADIIAMRGNSRIVEGAPYGYEGTKRWIKQVADNLGRDPEPSYMEKLEQKIRWVSSNGKQFMFSGLQNKAVIEGGAYVVKGLGEFFASELHFEVEGISTHSLKCCHSMPEFVKYYEEEKDKLDFLRSCENTLILGSEPVLSETRGKNMTLKISFPVLQGNLVAAHLPFVGIHGADAIMEYVLAYKNDMTIRFMMQ